LVGVLLILPTLATAQEATLSGTVVDATGGVWPGATLTAVLEASGNTFEGVTDERGVYRISRQTQELPVNGRDWIALSTLAPGMRANHTDLGPTTGERNGNREFQLNIDGQEVSVAQHDVMKPVSS